MCKDSIPYQGDPPPEDQYTDEELIPEQRTGPENSEDKKNGKDDKK